MPNLLTVERRNGENFLAVSSTGQRKRYLKPLHCADCGLLFFGSRSDARYCSQACQKRSWRKRKKREREELRLEMLGEALIKNAQLQFGWEV